MNIFLKLLKWDLLLLLKYRIVGVSIIIAVLYSLMFTFFPLEATGFKYEISIGLIFSDPSVMGFMFIGAIVLFEKEARTLQGLVVTPIEVWQYLWSKAVSLTILALPIALAIATVIHGIHFNYAVLILGIVLASLMFVFVGFIGVARVQTLNQYLIVIPLFLAPLCFPLVELFGFLEGYWVYVIPSKAPFLLFEGAFHGLELWQWAYAIGYSGVWIAIFYFFAKKSFISHIIPAS